MSVCVFTTFYYGQTQSEMNNESAKSFQDADKELNLIYQKVLGEYKTDKVFIANLRKAQNAWISFRDAEVLAKFPPREKGYYGSVLPTCLSSYKAKLTQERAKQLKVWLDGIAEGDTCSGSVKQK